MNDSHLIFMQVRSLDENFQLVEHKYSELEHNTTKIENIIDKSIKSLHYKRDGNIEYRNVNGYLCATAYIYR